MCPSNPPSLPEVSYVETRRRRELAETRKLKALEVIGEFQKKLQSSPKFYHARDLEINESVQGSGEDSYTIERLLGKGGMGIIYRAIHKQYCTPVVIKAVDTEVMEDIKQLQRFIIEARTIIALHHENLVEGIDFNYVPHSVYYVMEFLSGDTVDKILKKRRGPLDPIEGTKIVLQIAQALEYIDYHNLVHRDIKPSNILVTTENKAKLLDFGIAKESGGGGITAKGIIIGTPYYLSPEQITHTKVDIRSDIYSLGATLFHMVVGRLPFNGTQLVDILQQRLDSSPNPHEFNSELPRTLCNIITKMMAPKVDDRYATPTHLITDIQQFLEREARFF